MNFNRGLADLYRQFQRQKVPAPLWLRKAMGEFSGDKIICNVTLHPTKRQRAKGRKPYTCFRAVDRHIWAKLDDAARGRWLDTIRAEVGA